MNDNGNKGPGRRGTCFWCNKPGHFQSQCNARRRYLERNSQSPVAIIPDRSNVSTVDRSVVDSGSLGYNRITELAVVDSLPIPGIDGILGNDMLDCEGRELFPILSINASPVAVTTRSAARATNLLEDNDDDLMLSSVELDVGRPGSVESSGSDTVANDMSLDWDRAAFIKAQKDEFNFDLGDVEDLTKPSLARYFWWPGIKLSVKQFIRECEACQVMGKPNQGIPKAPLHPIPAIGDPFSELVIDVHITSAPYHPESQGLVERFHQTLKSVLKKLCYDNGSDWDKALPFALFAIRNHPNSSTGVAPFELVFGHNVRGPLEIVFEMLQSNRKGEVNIERFVEDLRGRMFSAWKFARENLELSQSIMKGNFDKKTKVRSFEPGELVLVLSMDPDSFLEPRYKGPWKVLRKLSEVNYEIEAPGSSRKCRIFHVNRLKPYHGRQGDPLAIVYEPVSVVVDAPPEESDGLGCQVPSDALGENMQNLEMLKSSLDHLDVNQQKDVLNLIYSFSDLFQDAPGRTNILSHDVDVGGASPVKQSPYRLNPVKMDLVSKEIEYMLKHDLIQPSVSPWSSPIVLVKKADGKFRMCVDYRKVNAHTKNDSFPLPRIDDCLDRIGSAKFITKLDLLKGYWQVPLSSRAREISAFVTPFGLYECKVMPFGMKNAACTFQRLMNRVICGLEGTEIYIDDLVVYSNDWVTHMVRLRKVFEALRSAGLVVNLAKCELGQAKVCYLGHEVGLGQVAPKQANLEAIINLKRPGNVREVRRVLGMTGYYRRFVRNYSDLAQPLTSLLEKGKKFLWSDQCEESFNKLKSVLITNPILTSQIFQKPFIIAVDASDIGIGGVLFQRKEDSVHPVSYYSKKLLAAERRYSTIEKEALSLVRALTHFKPYWLVKRDQRLTLEERGSSTVSSGLLILPDGYAAGAFGILNILPVYGYRRYTSVTCDVVYSVFCRVGAALRRCILVTCD
ncbi:uncharacterized protein [Macrobrachium rosenbergii]|uniref:uncharacterized protein n=1 Tax=Macrobrachium rosenbergii TaxID=79674 RepID=UPI0034D46BAF